MAYIWRRRIAPPSSCETLVARQWLLGVPTHRTAEQPRDRHSYTRFKMCPLESTVSRSLRMTNRAVAESVRM